MTPNEKSAEARVPVYCGRTSGGGRCKNKIAEVMLNDDGELVLIHGLGTEQAVLNRVYTKKLAGVRQVRSNGVPVPVTEYPGELGQIAKEIHHWLGELRTAFHSKFGAKQRNSRQQVEAQFDLAVERLTELVACAQNVETEESKLEQNRANMLLEWAKVVQATNRFFTSTFSRPAIVENDPVLVYCGCQSSRDGLIDIDDQGWIRRDAIPPDNIIIDAPGEFDAMFLALDPSLIRTAWNSGKQFRANDCRSHQMAPTAVVVRRRSHYCA